MTDVSITIIIPVKDEADNLKRLIPLLKPLGPVVVVDSGSTDDTVAVSENLGVTLIPFEWNGKFPKKRNWALRNHNFQTEWALFLDADEFISKAFIAEVKRSLRSTTHVGFWLNFENYFMGRKLRGGDPFRKLALFRVDAGEYERIEEDYWSQLDMEVHEHPVLKGTVGEIKTPIEHNDFRGLKHYIAKHNEYSSWEASRFLRLLKMREQSCVPLSDQGVNARPSYTSWENLSKRQKNKYKYISKWWFAPTYFIISFFFKRGFLDGAVGFHFALMKAIYFYQIRLKILDILRARQGSDS